MSVANSPTALELQGLYLPEPPDRREKYAYFRKQRRWVFAWLLIAGAPPLHKLTKFDQDALAPLTTAVYVLMIAGVAWTVVTPSLAPLSCTEALFASPEYTACQV